MDNKLVALWALEPNDARWCITLKVLKPGHSDYCLVLSEEYRLRFFERRMLRKMSRHKRKSQEARGNF